VEGPGCLVAFNLAEAVHRHWKLYATHSRRPLPLPL